MLCSIESAATYRQTPVLTLSLLRQVEIGASGTYPPLWYYIQSVGGRALAVRSLEDIQKYDQPHVSEEGDDICGLDWIRSSQWPQQFIGTPLRLVDLFCGCGGLTLGAFEAARRHRRTLDIRLAVDMSQCAISTYCGNFHAKEDFCLVDDIARLFPGSLGAQNASCEKRIAAKTGKVDLLVAGPPCQGHSDLNNHTRRNDPRNSLYLKVLRAAEVLRPDSLLIENVPAVVHDASGVVLSAVQAFRHMGYHTLDNVVDASRAGLPQRRKRHILVASKAAATPHALFSRLHSGCPSPVSEYLAGIEDEPEQVGGIFYTPSRMGQANHERVSYLFAQGLYDLPDYLRPPCHRDKPHTYRSMYGRLKWDQPAQTITTGFGSMGQGRFVHPTRPRVLTPHEAARLQGFPDFFDFSMVRTRRELQDMLGNSVPPRIGALVIDALLAVGAA